SDVIVLADERSPNYDFVELSGRALFHFPAARVVLVAERPEHAAAAVFATAPSLHFAVAAADAALIAQLRRGGEKTIDPRLLANQALAQSQAKLDQVVMSYIKTDVGGEFSDVRLNTPVAPKALPSEETVAAVLARPRTIGRVLLVIPSQFNVYGTKIKPAYPALGVMWIAAMLERAGHEVEIIDMDADDADPDVILTRLGEGRFDILGLTAVTPTYPNAVQIATAAKARFPHVTTILGGIHATVDPLPCAREAVFDFVAVGEAEVTAVELVDAIMAGVTDVSAIKGLVYRDAGGTVVASGARALVPDLDDYPYPALHLIQHLGKYAPPDATVFPAAPIMVSRGCPGQCTYCQTKNIFGRRTRFRSPENVIGEIRRLVYEHGVKEIHFLDDVITANRKFVRAFCDLLKREPYSLRLQVANGLRADMVNEEILTALRDVGLSNVGFGVESGNDRVLKIIKKGISKDQVRKAVQTAKSLGLETWAFFLFGLPGDTEESIRDTVDFAIELNPKYAKFAILKPFPGSEAYYQLDEKGLVDNRDYSQYGVYTPPVHHLETVSQERIFALQQQAVRRFYLRPSKMLEHARDIRSFGKFISFVRGGFFVLGQMRLRRRQPTTLPTPPPSYAPARVELPAAS
ncbi:MAG TPA: radical SAM protein, partial [Candidatus Dormibacteraeota bacterium]|nr:radical SAM protein [Candidatus Dormibacteraeota bacterium]